MVQATKHFTTRQIAKALDVSEASVKRWCDKGLIETTRTAGGHRRIQFEGIVRYLRDRRQPLPRPEVIGLPAATGKTPRKLDRASNEIVEALEAGEEERVRRILFDLYLAGTSCTTIGDRCIAPALNTIGDRWECGDTAVYQERRACEIVRRAIHELRAAIPSPPAEAPIAIGGTLSGDPYTVPTALVELVLRECGWQASSYGIDLPVETLCRAIEEESPRLVWVSASGFASPEDLVAAFETLYERAESAGAVLVAGGRALEEGIRSRLRFTVHCDTLQHLVAFAKTIHPTSRTGSS